MKLKLSGDRKVSTKNRWQLVKKTGNYVAKPKVFNSFGLPAILSCPEYTEWCMQVCYAFNLQRAWSTVDNLVNHNLSLLKACGSNVSRMVTLLSEMIESIDWKGTTPVFRWHWDGDIFSRQYAIAIAETCRKFPNIQFWLYTRSFDYIPEIIDIPNLTVYLSVDAYNLDKAIETYDRHPSLLIAACHETWDGAESIMRKVVSRNAPRCPELTHKIPLVTESGEGACVACGLCIYGRNHVRFASSN